MVIGHRFPIRLLALIDFIEPLCSRLREVGVFRGHSPLYSPVRSGMNQLIGALCLCSSQIFNPMGFWQAAVTITETGRVTGREDMH